MADKNTTIKSDFNDALLKWTVTQANAICNCLAEAFGSRGRPLVSDMVLFNLGTVDMYKLLCECVLENALDLRKCRIYLFFKRDNVWDKRI